MNTRTNTVIWDTLVHPIPANLPKFVQRGQAKFGLHFVPAEQENSFACRYEFNGSKFLTAIMLHKDKCFVALWGINDGELSEILWNVVIEYGPRGKFLLKDHKDVVLNSGMNIDVLFEQALWALVHEIKLWESFSTTMF
jgi:hypothetical protein